MSESKVYPVPEEFAENAHINRELYEAMYQRSIEDPRWILGRSGKCISRLVKNMGQGTGMGF